jgi:hypothetical protein
VRQGNFVEVVDQFNDQFTFTDHALDLEFKDKGRLREFLAKIREHFPDSERKANTIFSSEDCVIAECNSARRRSRRSSSGIFGPALGLEERLPDRWRAYYTPGDRCVLHFAGVYRSADVKTRFMPRLSKKSRAFRILSAAKTRTLHSRPPLYRFQETFHAIKTGRYPNRNAKLLLQLSASLGYSQPVKCGCLPPQSPTVNSERRSANCELQTGGTLPRSVE